MVLGSGPRCRNWEKKPTHMCEPIGRWLKPACEMVSGWERKEMKDTPTRRVW